MAESLAARVRATLRDRTEPLWFPARTPDLVASGQRRLADRLGIRPSEYGTLRVLRGTPAAPRTDVAEFRWADEPASPTTISIEALPEDVAAGYAESGVRLVPREALARPDLGATVGCALEVLGRVATVRPTVQRLVRSLHLVDAGDNEMDVSFSEPALPFSIFVSVPSPYAADGPLRVAEAVLHEAMHLQLTLVEQEVPLVLERAGTYYSPWREEHRTVQGVLHALYVFRVIDEFFAALAGAVADPGLRAAAARRRTTIAEQVGQITAFRACVGLTTDGAELVERLLG